MSRPVAVITGASRGIGMETSRRLAEKGYAMVLAARSEAALQILAGELEAMGAECLVVPTDVQSREQLQNLARKTIEWHGRIDVVLHNAGVVHPGLRLGNLSTAEVDSILDTNLIAPIELTRAFLPTMIEQNSGYIGFVGSVGGHIALPTASLYSATKFGLRGFAMALRREVAAHGIRVCLISPGYVKTELTDPVWEIMEGYPMVMGTVDSVASAIVKSIQNPRREFIMPVYYRLFVWCERNAPFIMDGVAAYFMKKILPGYEKRLAGRTDPPRQ